MLREAEVLPGKGQNIAETCRGLGITEQTHYRWRTEYGELRVDQVKRLKELEQENARLKKVVAEMIVDTAILMEAAQRNFSYVKGQVYSLPPLEK